MGKFSRRSHVVGGKSTTHYGLGRIHPKHRKTLNKRQRPSEPKHWKDDQYEGL